MGVILLVRHGQASFGSADYDVLSPLGERQARCLGAALAKRGVRPASVVSGSIRRQLASAAALAAAAGWPLEPSADAGWNEFEHRGLAADPGAGPHKNHLPGLPPERCALPRRPRPRIGPKPGRLWTWRDAAPGGRLAGLGPLDSLVPIQ